MSRLLSPYPSRETGKPLRENSRSCLVVYSIAPPWHWLKIVKKTHSWKSQWDQCIAQLKESFVGFLHDAWRAVMMLQWVRAVLDQNKIMDWKYCINITIQQPRYSIFHWSELQNVCGFVLFQIYKFHYTKNLWENEYNIKKQLAKTHGEWELCHIIIFMDKLLWTPMDCKMP